VGVGVTVGSEVACAMGMRMKKNTAQLGPKGRQTAEMCGAPTALACQSPGAILFIYYIF
jgi:hypothetical protein